MEGECLQELSHENGDTLEEEEDLDPRVTVELEKLNLCSEEINRLENEIDEARVKYRMTFSEASQKMAKISKEQKNSIQKSREYYQLREEAKQTQSESLKAARQYQSAIGVYRAAKETVALAEERLVQGAGGEVQLTSAWQEMLNHATIRVMEAEREKRQSEDKHQRMTAKWREQETRLQFLEKKFKRAIANSRGYFEMKQQLDLRLQQQKQNVTDLQQCIIDSKVKYAEALRSLESISSDIHESRRQKLLLMYPRQPGVGAESLSSTSSMSELTMEQIAVDYSDKSSRGSGHDIDDEYTNDDDMFKQQCSADDRDRDIQDKCTDLGGVKMRIRSETYGEDSECTNASLACLENEPSRLKGTCALNSKTDEIGNICTKGSKLEQTYTSQEYESAPGGTTNEQLDDSDANIKPPIVTV